MRQFSTVSLLDGNVDKDPTACGHTLSVLSKCMKRVFNCLLCMQAKSYNEMKDMGNNICFVIHE